MRVRVRCYAYNFEACLPVILNISRGSWSLTVHPFHWRRMRGGWPRRWRDYKPAWPGPIFRFWHLGPCEVRRYREDVPRGELHP